MIYLQRLGFCSRRNPITKLPKLEASFRFRTDFRITCLNSKSPCAREPIGPNSIWRSQLVRPYFRGVPIVTLFLPLLYTRPEHRITIPSPSPPASSFSPSCVHNGDTIDSEAQSIVTRSTRRKRHDSPLHRLWMAYTRSTPMDGRLNPRHIRALSRKSMTKTPFCFWYKSTGRTDVRRKFPAFKVNEPFLPAITGQ